MNKVIILLVLSFLYCNFALVSEGNLSGKEYRRYSPPVRYSYSFTDSRMTILEEGGDKLSKHEEYPYRLVKKNGIDFIQYGENFENEWLAIHNDSFLYLYDKDDYPFFHGSMGSSIHSFIFSGSLFDSSSDLTEVIQGKEIIYNDDNIGVTKIPSPWVEGVEGDGIGEKLLISKGFKAFLIFHISNGYVSYSRPDLYEKNNRIKTLLIRNLTTLETWTVELEDTPNFQMLTVKSSNENTEVELEILDVYHGTEYQDTCLNYIGYQYGLLGEEYPETGYIIDIDPK